MRHNKRCIKCKRFIPATPGYGNYCWFCALMNDDNYCSAGINATDNSATILQNCQSITCKARGYEEPLPTFNRSESVGLLQIFIFFVLAVALAGGILWVIFNVKF